MNVRSPVRILLLLLLLVITSIGCQPKKKITRPHKPKVKIKKENLVDFYQGGALSPILDLAKKKDKPVYLYMSASWCLPCRNMEEDVYTHAPTAKYLNANFINYKVDIEKDDGPDLYIIYQVQTLPTLIFLDHKGRVLSKKEGAAYHRELRQLGDTALSKFGG